MPRIVVVGSTNVDLAFRLSRLPSPGETLSASTMLIGHGGKGANQAVMAARLGAHVVMVSAVGDDAFGREALENYCRQGIDVQHVRVRAEYPTGTAAIMVDDAANNSIVVASGANGSVTVTDVRSAETAIHAADAVLTQLETPVEAAIDAFRLARASGVRTLLNPAPARPLPDDLLSLTDICVPNESELSVLSGHRVGSFPEVESAARRLLHRGPRAVLVTLGERGALMVTADQTESIPAITVEAIDPTAAGDAFLGCLAVALSEGDSLIAAARRACAVAALTVTRPGAQSSFPSREELAKFLCMG
jgi:ribokinase